MTTILEALAARMSARKTSANDVLVGAARRLAAGESADDAAIERAMLEANMSLADFRALVELAQRRREWYAALDRGPAAVAKRDKVLAVIERERAQFEQIRNQWIARANELDAEHNAADKLAEAARDARGKLVHPDNVPGTLADAIREAHDNVATTAGEVERIRRDMRDNAEREKSQREWADQKRRLNQVTPAGDANDHERMADRAARRLKELAAELPAAEAAAAKAVADLERLETAALKT